MRTPKPETTASILFDRVFGYMNADEQPTPFELRRLEKEIDALARHHAAAAFEIRAGLAALQWDVERVHRELRNQLLLDNNALAFLNASATSAGVNDMHAAVDYARQAWTMAPNDQAVCDQFLSTLLHAGRLHEATKLGQQMNLSPDGRQTMQLATHAAQVLDALGVTENRVIDELAAAHAVLTQRRIRNQRTDFGTQFDPEGGRKSIVAMLRFRGDFDDESALAIALSERMSDSTQWNPAEFAIAFVPDFAGQDALFAA